MGENTRVEYVKHSFSGWHGCHHKSPGCKNCFAETLANRWGKSDLWHLHGPRRIVSDDQWREPRKWNEAARQEGERARVLCGTMFDFLEDHPDVKEARSRLFRLIEDTPWLLWLLFTKRPENAGMIPWGDSWPDNTALIASVENQQYFDERVSLVLDTAAPLKGLSVEPLLSGVNMETCSWAPPGSEGLAGVHNPLTGQWRPAAGLTGDRGGIQDDQGRLGWIIVGGESGSGVRPMHPQWVRDIYRQCQGAGVPTWFKQWGTWSPDGKPEWPADDVQRNPKRHLLVDPRTGKTKPVGAAAVDGDRDWAHMKRVGKGAAGHLLDGREINELPDAAYWTPAGRAA